MAEGVIGALVSVGVEHLIKKLTSPEVVGFFKRHKLDEGLLKKLKRTMGSVKKLLNDAEKKQITDAEVKVWLDHIKDAVYKADDFLDEISYEAMRLESEAGPQTQTRSSQVRSLLSFLMPCRKGIGDTQPDLERISQNLEHLVEQKDVLGLIEDIGGNPQSERIPTSSVVAESGFFGREADKEAIMKMLLSDDANGKCLGVISIVGMPGVGKTTLAQLLYNENEVKEWFDLKAWVYVSEEFNVLKITKDILKGFGIQECDNMTSDQLHCNLQEKVKDRKVLVVLDDVWSENERQWDFVLKPFISVKQGSKIIVTTRHESVARVKSTFPLYLLRELNEDNCWLVFEKHAFDGGNSDEHPDLKEIGQEIVRKCGGLPLAARALGSLLRCSRNGKSWEKILKTSNWDSPNDGILPALKLSYHHLPPNLKQCFAYCGMFPKGYQYRKEELLLLWISEGFSGYNLMEEGEDCFDKLVSRSFLQQSNVDLSRFVMHDLFNELSKSVSGEFSITMKDDESCQPSERTRHLFYSGRNFSTFKSICNCKAPHLRTLIASGVNLKQSDGRCVDAIFLRFKRLRVLSLAYFTRLVELSDSISNLKHLRLLNLTRTSIPRIPDTVSTLHNLQAMKLDYCYCLIKLPDSIGNLKHLQHLSLQGTQIQRLPESTSCLYNLQTLNLSDCYWLVELPTNMMKLTKLCYLDIRGTSLKSMPSEMGKLTNLKQLTDFFLGNQCGSGIQELGNLQHLEGELCIRNLQNVVNRGDVSDAILKNKKHLEKLEFIWKADSDPLLHHRVLDQLEPHTRVRSLSIFCYRGQRLPNWVGDSSFSHMVTLYLKGCKYLSTLPPLGTLPSLKDLSIVEFDGVIEIGHEFYGNPISKMKPFASLEVLRFENMALVHQWQGEVGAFSVLQELYVINCSNLKTTVPSYLPSLTRLVVLGCGQFLSSLPRCSVIHEMDINHGSVKVRVEKMDSGLYKLAVEGFHSLDEALIVSVMEQVDLSPPMFETVVIHSFHSLDVVHLEDFTSLESLHFSSCPNFSFSIVELAAPRLARLRITDCLSLQSLPENMHSHLPSLMDLDVSSCPELESVPRGGLPSKLQSLRIHNCQKFVANRMQWGLQILPSLLSLRIHGCNDVESFPEETLLPSTLTSLEIWDFEDLKYLNHRGIQHLSTLEKLSIWDCPHLLSLPQEGLPSSVSYLEISDCPKLNGRCEKGRGEDWPKISHIPYVGIN